ncbi:MULTISPECIES: hypothetical protein [unclassified Bartonella]|uniref:hypothetical protein n=1 Tax=unclassified Bartonella TaxID=2645622 RepID=UPI0035D0FE53
MLIKQSLLRSVLIIALLTTHLFYSSKGYTHSNEVFSSKEITERESFFRIFLVNGSRWWEEKFYQILWIEKTFFLENKQQLSQPLYEKHVNIIKKWQNIIKKRHHVFNTLCTLIELEIDAMRHVNEAKHSHKHTHLSNLMKHIETYQERIVKNKKELEKLDHEIEILYKVIIEYTKLP